MKELGAWNDLETQVSKLKIWILEIPTQMGRDHENTEKQNLCSLNCCAL